MILNKSSAESKIFSQEHRKLRVQKAIHNMLKTRRGRIRRRNLAESSKKLLEKPIPRKHYLSEKKIPDFNFLMPHEDEYQDNEKVLLYSQPSMNLLEVPLNDDSRFHTPDKKRQRSNFANTSPCSPIVSMKNSRKNLEKGLRGNAPLSFRNNLIKDYDAKMRETEKWIQGRFEMVIQDAKLMKSKTKNSNLPKSKLINSKNITFKTSNKPSTWDQRKKVLLRGASKLKTSNFLSKV
mmetsp:Transcript_38575/g.38093  ORF Transcript_38575/g.38093 Transcript_38575/m.38093 type:complete len:236 (-) Transcript_38575:38-745(-)